MRVPTSNELMTTLLSGLLSFVLVGCTQFPDNFDLAAKNSAPSATGSHLIPAASKAASAAN